MKWLFILKFSIKARVALVTPQLKFGDKSSEMRLKLLINRSNVCSRWELCVLAHSIRPNIKRIFLVFGAKVVKHAAFDAFVEVWDSALVGLVRCFELSFEPFEPKALADGWVADIDRQDKCCCRLLSRLVLKELEVTLHVPAKFARDSANLSRGRLFARLVQRQ